MTSAVPGAAQPQDRIRDGHCEQRAQRDRSAGSGDKRKVQPVLKTREGEAARRKEGLLPDEGRSCPGPLCVGVPHIAADNVFVLWSVPVMRACALGKRLAEQCPDFPERIIACALQDHPPG